MKLPVVTLVPLTAEQREAFVAEEIANYAEEQIRDAGWPREAAVERARDALAHVLEGALAEAGERGDRLWSAIDEDGRMVGWVWVKPLQPDVAFLEQLTVVESQRRRGYGRAMLAALEELLRDDGIEDLRLNVNRANEPAQGLYAHAGYDRAGVDERRLFLRKRLYDCTVIPEAPLDRTEHGLLPAGDGWFVLNGREAEWRRWTLGKWPRLEGATPRFEQLGVGLTVLEPGEPMTMYHRETDQEDFLVLAGEALAIVEGQERPLRQWDLLHCPAGTNHAIVGAGSRPCVVFAVGSREHHTYRTPNGEIDGRDDWGAYTVDEAALRHGAGVAEETTRGSIAYGRFGDPESTAYREGWLPDQS